MLTESQKAALAQLVLHHQGRVRAFLCRFETDPAVLDELTQDVFIGILGRCEELARRPEEQAAKYLQGVARNLARLRWRNRQAGETVSLRALLEREWEADLDREPDDSDRRAGALTLCLERLSAGARSLVTRHFFQGTPIVDLARDVKQSDAAIRMLLFRIRRQLRVCVETRLKEGLAP
jgi:RNA polymerase sigma-70 factor (ECF subfamily)